MKRVTMLCVLSMLISFSGCSKKDPEPMKMTPCHVPYTVPADINNIPCPHDAHFYTCVRVKTLKNDEAKKYEIKMREQNAGVCQ